MKKIFIMLILPFIFLSVSCNSGAIRYYEEGNFEKAIEIVNESKHPTSEDYLAVGLSYSELGLEKEALDNILLYLLSDSSQASGSTNREKAVDFFLSQNITDELTILSLVPSDGTPAQIALYKAYSNLNDTKNARQLLDLHLSKELTYSQFATLIVNYPVEPTYITGIFESWYDNLKNDDKETFSSLLNELAGADYMTDQCSRSLIYLAQCCEEDSFFTSKPTLLKNIYYAHSKALKRIGETTQSLLYLRRAENIKEEEPK